MRQKLKTQLKDITQLKLICNYFEITFCFGGKFAITNVKPSTLIRIDYKIAYHC